MDGIEIQKDQKNLNVENIDQKKIDEISLSKEKELHDNITENTDDKQKLSELSKTNSSVMDVDNEHETNITKESSHIKMEINKDNGNHSSENESSNEHITKIKKKDQIDIILGKKIKKLIKKKNVMKK
ncbi:hypothetical protein PIROE2DRAFT_60545 [Piromyces sp. E2]|nr:hypothetical protein PIROE2DRAFT_60545 [Piromyces sp. E2]|eukprot:OUM64585.1 hypothetical protein PIROE2DRAFT_60545 [Piromyces sp. E2]